VLPDGRLLRDPQVLRAVVNDDSATARAIDRAAELQAVADVGGNAGLVAATAGLAVMLTPLLLLDGNRGPDDPLIVGLYLGGLGAALAGVAALGAIAPAATEAAQLRASALVLAPRDMAAHLQVPTSDKEPAPDAPRSIPFP
jgi:hypothetical protein